MFKHILSHFFLTCVVKKIFLIFSANQTLINRGQTSTVEQAESFQPCIISDHNKESPAIDMRFVHLITSTICNDTIILIAALMPVKLFYLCAHVILGSGMITYFWAENKMGFFRPAWPMLQIKQSPHEQFDIEF
jgi:hypothetical protein